MSRGRAFRRWQVEKWKRRVVQYHGGYMRADARHAMSEAERARHIGRIARTRQPCSCWGCGNPRRAGNGKWFGPTMQERRALSAMEE